MFVAAFGLVVAACGGTDTGDSAETPSTTVGATATTATPQDDGAVDTTATTAGESDGGEDSTTTTTAATEPPPVVDGPDAPDFALALASGETFVLSDEQKPVYLVFWAEW